jgi:hypothetical protein
LAWVRHVGWVWTQVKGHGQSLSWVRHVGWV